MYQKMYAILCGAISDAIDAMPLNAKNFHARAILQKALTDAEEIFLSAGEEMSSTDLDEKNATHIAIVEE